MKAGTIIIDPPWPYERASKHRKLTGYVSQKYKSLTIADLAALPISSISAEKCVLLLWTTWPFIKDALGLVDTWGFKYKTGLPWVKVAHIEEEGTSFRVQKGVGYWFRGCTEPLLVGARGGSYRTGYDGILASRMGHSQKPDLLYKIVEEKFPPPWLELFARRHRKDWTQMGDQLGGDGGDIRESIRLLL